MQNPQKTPRPKPPVTQLNAGVSSVDAKGRELLMPTVADLSLQVR